MDHHLSKVSSYKVPYFQVETLLGGKNTFLIFVAAEDLNTNTAQTVIFSFKINENTNICIEIKGQFCFLGLV